MFITASCIPIPTITIIIPPTVKKREIISKEFVDVDTGTDVGVGVGFKGRPVEDIFTDYF